MAQQGSDQSISAEVAKSVNDAQKLLKYIAKDGGHQLDPEVTRQLVLAKYRISQGQWDAETEASFWIHYDALVSHIYPVTLESIRSIKPESEVDRKVVTRADKAVRWCRISTISALVVLLLVQFYWLLGYNLHGNLKDLFAQREKIGQELKAAVEQEGAQIKSLTAIQESMSDNSLQKQHSIINQQLDSNLKLLILWNRVWSLGYDFDDELPFYLRNEYEMDKRQLEATLQKQFDSDTEQALQKLELGQVLYKARINLFSNTLAAEFAIELIQSFILPLLYGLLGAFIYVLRMLLRDIKELTYTPDSDTRYRLRLTLGSLGGMIIGWFMQPQDFDSLSVLSPMALAFLMGYNVDVFFSVMDRFIDNIKAWIDRPSDQKSAHAQSAPMYRGQISGAGSGDLPPGSMFTNSVSPALVMSNPGIHSMATYDPAASAAGEDSSGQRAVHLNDTGANQNAHEPVRIKPDSYNQANTKPDKLL